MIRRVGSLHQRAEQSALRALRRRAERRERRRLRDLAEQQLRAALLLGCRRKLGYDGCLSNDGAGGFCANANSGAKPFSEARGVAVDALIVLNNAAAQGAVRDAAGH